MRRIGIAVAGGLAAAALAWYYWLGLTSVAGAINDDVVYLTLGKGLATGQGYRDLNVPGTPPHVGYPPLYPLALAAVWAMWPEFPANVLAFKALNIPWALLTIGLTGLLAMRVYGLPAWQAAAAMAIYAFGRVVVVQNDLTMSETLFALILVAALLAIERLAARAEAAPPPAWLPVAIALAAVAPLMTRTIGLCVPVGAVAWLLLRGQRGLALRVAAWAAVFFAPWVLYVRQARAQAVSFDYVGWTVSNTGGLDPARLATEVAAHVPEVLTRSIPGAVVPGAAGLGALAVSAVVLAGLARLARPRVRLVHWVLAGYFAIILPFPWGTDRYVAALAPLLVLAFVRGAAWPADVLLAMPGRRPAVKALAIALTVAALLPGLAGAKRVVGLLRRDAHHDALLAPRHRAMHEDQAAIAAWAAGHLPPDAVWLSLRPPLWYLWTGHASVAYDDGAEPSPGLRALLRARPGYVVHGVRPTFGWRFAALLAAHPGKAERVFTGPNGEFEVYRLAREW